MRCDAPAGNESFRSLYSLSYSRLTHALPVVAEVLTELFSAEGSELYVVPLHSLVPNPGEVASFHELARRARSRGDILLGAFCAAVEPTAAGEEAAQRPVGAGGKPRVRRAVLNPPDKHEPRVWSEMDFFVLLAGAERTMWLVGSTRVDR